jgi:hypothetical protein
MMNDFKDEKPSYKNLIKYIEDTYPVDSSTKKDFSLNERITIKNFLGEMIDVF